MAKENSENYSLNINEVIGGWTAWIKRNEGESPALGCAHYLHGTSLVLQ